ncbi:MAG: TIGR04283 family arsenosugar biosynthesis glycosyltransferase [Thermodesulfobacteriota bacterium]|nr:TIGR04283 family arsenosugar biosynthesis glycosyltransferase [Thermodesulfobacteriota bacterium]
MKLSIVIPVLNEAEILGDTLGRLARPSGDIMVVDGGSTDGTVEIARQYTSRVITSPRGRGPQQDAGARQSHGSVLLFLHADTRLPMAYERLVHEALEGPGVVFGAFHLKIHPSKPILAFIASMANLRSRLLRMPYGDQALFARREAYFEAGGFPDWPVMEDVDLVRRLNRLGGFQLARGSVLTSGRRWKKENAVFTTLRNWSLMTRYYMGHRPHTLAGHYPDAR